VQVVVVLAKAREGGGWWSGEIIHNQCCIPAYAVVLRRNWDCLSRVER
jgi:hypothetical protein